MATFNQVSLETHEGHLSVCVELDRDPVQVAAQVADMLEHRSRSITGQTTYDARRGRAHLRRSAVNNPPADHETQPRPPAGDTSPV
jgi:hypothetical protein